MQEVPCIKGGYVVYRILEADLVPKILWWNQKSLCISFS